MLNNITLVGRLTRDPETREVGESTVANITLAVDRDYTNKDGERDTDFIPVELWNGQARFAADYLEKGRLVGVEGSLRIDRREDQDGNTVSFTKVSARRIQALDSKRSNNTEEQQEEEASAKPSVKRPGNKKPAAKPSSAKRPKAVSK